MLNPYVEWLGLDAHIEQPNHFELFGLDCAEDRVEFISIAADRAMVKVRRCRPGEQAKQWAGLLDQLEQAKRILIDPQLRQDYRDQLRSDSRLPPKAAEPQQVQSPRGETESTKSQADARMPNQKFAATPPSSQTKTSEKTSKQRQPSTQRQPATQREPSSMPTSISAAMAPPSNSTNAATNADSKTATATGASATVTAAGPSSDVPVLRKAISSPESPTLERPTTAAPNTPAPYTTGKPIEPNLDAADAEGANPTDELDPMAPVAIPKTQVADEIDPMAPVAAAQLSSPIPGQSHDQASPTLNPSLDADSVVPGSSTIDGEDFRSHSAAGMETTNKPRTVSDQPVMIAEDQTRGRSSGTKRLAIAGGLVSMLVVLVVVLVWQLPGMLGGDTNTNDSVADGSDVNNTDDSGTIPNGDSANQSGNQSNDNSNDDNASTDTSADDDDADVGDQSSSTNASDDSDQTDVNNQSTAVVNNGTGDDMSDDTTDDVAVDDPTDDTTGNDSTGDDAATSDEMVNNTDGANSSTDREPEVSDVIAFGEGLAEVQQMLFERQIDEALTRLTEVRETIPHRAEDAELADRLSIVADHVEAFWEAVESGASMLQGGEELKYSETTIVLVVEVQPELLIYRFEGTNHRKHPRDLPAGLAMLVAEKGLPSSASEARLVKGAFYAIERLNKPSLGERAIEFWEEAELMGADVEQLLLYLEDDYSLESSIVEQGPMPSADAIEAASQAVADQVRESHGTVTSSSERIRVAEELLTMAPKASDPAERYALFVEAADWAARAGDTPIVIAAADSLAAWYVLEDGLQIKTDWLVQAGRANGGVEAAKETARTAIEVAEVAIDDDRLEIAESLLQTALLASRRSRDRNFQDRTLERVTAIREQLED